MKKKSADRHNEGKPRFSLIPWRAALEEAHVWTLGAKKYGDWNWTRLWGDQTVNTVLDSTERHINAIKSGEFYDEETGRHHAAHIRCNMAMLIEYHRDPENRAIMPQKYREDADA